MLIRMLGKRFVLAGEPRLVMIHGRLNLRHQRRKPRPRGFLFRVLCLFRRQKSPRTWRDGR